MCFFFFIRCIKTFTQNVTCSQHEIHTVHTCRLSTSLWLLLSNKQHPVPTSTPKQLPLTTNTRFLPPPLSSYRSSTTNTRSLPPPLSSYRSATTNTRSLPSPLSSYRSATTNTRPLPPGSVQSPLRRGGGSEEQFVPQPGIGEKPMPQARRTANHLAQRVHVLDEINLQAIGKTASVVIILRRTWVRMWIGLTCFSRSCCLL